MRLPIDLAVLITPWASRSPGRSLQRRVLRRVFLEVELRRDQDLRGELLAVQILDDAPHGLAADLAGELDRVGVDLPVQNRPLALQLPVDPDDQPLPRQARLLDRGERAQGRRV